jgi:hypothetical protein
MEELLYEAGFLIVKSLCFHFDLYDVHHCVWIIFEEPETLHLNSSSKYLDPIFKKFLV